jgi:hypothetical protein
MSIKIDIKNFDEQPGPVDFDVLCLEKIDYLDNVTHYSLVTVEVANHNLKIRFDWKEGKEITESDFIYIPESNTLFFRSLNQWGAIDLEKKTLRRHEQSYWTPWIERRGNFVLIEDDLSAESTRLNGDKIHSVPIDPPTEAKEFEDRIEFNSPVFGRQVLITK